MDTHLAIYLAKGWDEEKLISGQIKTLTAKTLKIQIPNIHQTIKQLKHKIEDQYGIPVEKQTLMKIGKTKLKDEKTLDDYFIKSGQTLMLVVEGELPKTMNRELDKDQSLFLKERPEPTKVITVTEEEAAKQKKEEWWKEKGMMSGPMGKKLETTETATTTTKNRIKPTCSPVGGKMIKPTDPKERRELLKKLSEKRLRHFENLEICSSYRTYPLEGNYGPKGVPSTEYYPSSRYFTQSSYNKEQNILWVFGGVEDYEDGDEIMFNDLWKYNLSSNEWTWVSGSSIPDQKSVYYEKGKPHADNVPGARYGGCFWEDSNGALWLFGGLGFSVTENKGILADLWKYENGSWTFVGGSDELFDQGYYSEPKIPDPNAYPPARTHAACWKDKNGHFWLHAGALDDCLYLIVSSVNGIGNGYFADTWRFDGQNWTYWGGPKSTNSTSVHGQYREFSEDYHPGGRHASAAVVSQTDDGLYLIGGYNDKRGFADIWKFEKDKGWALWAGEPTNSTVHPGTIRVPSENNLFGHRIAVLAVIDDDENIWIHGGAEAVFHEEKIRIYGDTWVYNQTYFVWMDGNATEREANAVYATGPDQLSSNNSLGAAGAGYAFLDRDGIINLYGMFGMGNLSFPRGFNNYWKIAYGYECFGKSICKNSLNEICSGNGKCVGKDICSCNPGFTGNECQENTECIKPEIISSRFNTDATKILLNFNVPMNTQEIPPSCDLLFQDGYKLGTNATCAYTSPTTLTITLDNNLIAGENLTIIENTLEDANCEKFIDSQTIIILPPAGAQKPVAVVNAPPLLGGCQNLTLESASYGFGTLKYSWRHIDGEVFSNEVADLLRNLSDTTTTAEIPAHLLEPGISKFELIVTDLFGQFDVATISVEKSASEQVPIAFILGETTRKVKRNVGFFIESSATFSPCVPAYGKRLSFTWSVSPSIELGSSKNSPKLYVSPYSLNVGKEYNFQLSVGVIDINNDQELSNSTLNVFVTVEPSNLIAKIAGGSRSVPASSTLVVDASSSFDPDTPTAILTYQWTCCKKETDSCNVQLCLQVFDDLPNYSGSKYTKVPTSPFPAGTYVFSVHVSSQDQRVAQTETEITIKPEPIPIVSIKTTASETVVHNTGRPLLLTAFVQSESTDLIYNWTVVNGNLDLSDKNVAPFGTDQLQLYIEGSKLTETQYTFQFSASPRFSLATGSAQVLHLINLPPFGGTLVSNIPQARSLQDTIRLTTSGWIDVSEDLPLKYTFYQVVQLENGETIDQPLHPFPQSKAEFSFIAPAVDKDEMITFKVVAFDNKNAGAAATTTVQILAFQKASNETNEDFAEKLIDENLEFLLSEGNFDKVIRYIDNVAEVLRLSTGMDPDSVQKRTLLKNKLLELYGKVFKSNVNFINGDLRTSVITTLSKLVGNANEISEQSSSETLNLLSLTFQMDSEFSIAIEPLPDEVGQQAIVSISNLIEASGVENQTQIISKTISNIGRLALIDKPARTRVEFNSTQIRLLQAREYANEVIGKSIKNDDSEISLPNGVFNHIDPVQRETLGVVDVRLLKWTNNPHTNIKTETNITSPVISADLLDEFGVELKIENLENPIQIKVPSNLAKPGYLECRYLNITSSQWVQIGLEEVKEGEYTICTTTHLSDFATFIASDSEPQEGFNPHWLWLLLLLIPGVAIIATVAALIIIILKNRKKENIEQSMKKDSDVNLLEVKSQQPVENEVKTTQNDVELPDIPLNAMETKEEISDLPDIPTNALQ